MRVIKRLRLELQEVRDEGASTGIRVVPQNGNIFDLLGTIRGPKNSPYKGGLFELDIHIPPDYAFKAPKIRFITPVFHPFVSSTGDIGLVRAFPSEMIPVFAWC